jgi:hypothetical protein
MGRMLYGGDISRCAAAHDSIIPRFTNHNDTMNSYLGQFNAAQGQVQETKNEITLADAKITKLRNYLSWLTDANNRISTTLHEDCAGLKSNVTIEELKHRCGNIQFDNANVKLPACTTEACASWVVYANMKPKRTPEQAIQDYKNSGAANPTRNPGLDKTNVPAPTEN